VPACSIFCRSSQTCHRSLHFFWQASHRWLDLHSLRLKVGGPPWRWGSADGVGSLGLGFDTGI
jgi:hypothetical protein